MSYANDLIATLSKEMSENAIADLIAVLQIREANNLNPAERPRKRDERLMTIGKAIEDSYLIEFLKSL